MNFYVIYKKNELQKYQLSFNPATIGNNTYC